LIAEIKEYIYMQISTRVLTCYKNILDI